MIRGHVHNILLTKTKRLQSSMSFLLEKPNMERNRQCGVYKKQKCYSGIHGFLFSFLFSKFSGP